MKKLYWINTILLMVFLSSSIYSQRIAICGFNTDTDDGFAIVIREAFAGGDDIFITDWAYVPANNTYSQSASSEAIFRYVATGAGHAAGTVIRVVEGSSWNEGNNDYTVTSSDGSPGTFDILDDTGLTVCSFSSNNDCLHAFDSDTPTDPENDVDVIYHFICVGDLFSPQENPNDDGNAPIDSEFINGPFSSSGTDDNWDFGDEGVAADRINVTSAEYETLANWNRTDDNQTLSISPFTGSFLPVELINFKADAILETAVILTWVTASEMNNEKFEIEYSDNGQIFRKIGETQGNGTSYEKQQYSFIHQQPALGLNYYRLKQIDFDGHFESSKIVSIKFDGETNMNIYPNPTDGILNITTTEMEESTIEIRDVMGRIVKKPFPFKSRIDLSEFSNGIYFIHLNSETQSIVKRILKKKTIR